MMPQIKATAPKEWVSEMRRLFDSARYTRAAALYEARVEAGERPSNDAILLRARTYLRTDSKRVVQFLLKNALHKPTRVQEARRAMYLGTGYSRLADFAEADRSFVRAKSEFRDGAPQAELAAHISRRYLDERDITQAEEWQRRTLVDRSLAGKIRSEHLASYILARNERYRDQAASLIRVLDLIGEKREQFAEHWYVAVHTLAALAREVPLPEAARRVKAEVDFDFDWSEDAMVSRFQALKAVAWTQALAGDELSCLRYLRRAQHINAGPVWRAILYLDRSYFASIVGEKQWAANEFSAAEDLAEDVAWDETSSDERVALLLLAELATIHAPKRARFYIARFNDLGKMRSNLLQFTFDDRLQAMAAYTSGIVSLASGDNQRAEDSLRVAWGTFDRIGYDVRAGLAALGLYRATQKMRWLHLGEEKLESYPRSWLSRFLGEVTATAPARAVELSKMQGAVTRLLCEGLSTDAVAQQLAISRNTVLNHLKVVYRKLGVNSRGALVAEAMKRKIAR